MSDPRRLLPASAALLGVLGCGSPAAETGTTTAIADLKNKVVYLNGIPGDFLGAELVADGCPVLRSDATATLNGQPIPLKVGRHNITPVIGMGPCYSPLARADLHLETATELDLAISDPTQTVEVRLVGYHPFSSAIGDLPSSSLAAGQPTMISITQHPDMPDRIDATFYADHGTPNIASWVATCTLANGAISFTVPASAAADTGTLVVCGGYTLSTSVGSCSNAACNLSPFTRDDCRNYSGISIQ